MFLKKIPIIQLKSDAGAMEVDDILIKEERIALYLNNKKLLSIMSLPKDQDAHAVGFLMSEGVIGDVRDITNIKIAKDGLSVHIDARINEDNITNLFHEKTLTSGCCVGVSANFEGKVINKVVSATTKLTKAKMFELMREFSAKSELFQASGCVHKAMLVVDEKTCIISEDIGRHNAIDKVMGRARLDGLNVKGAILLVSGRLSMEMVIKAGMHDIAILISRAACTQLGVQAAQQQGITMIGFARDGRANLYTHPQRIID